MLCEKLSSGVFGYTSIFETIEIEKSGDKVFFALDEVECLKKLVFDDHCVRRRTFYLDEVLKEKNVENSKEELVVLVLREKDLERWMERVRNIWWDPIVGLWNAWSECECESDCIHEELQKVLQCLQSGVYSDGMEDIFRGINCENDQCWIPKRLDGFVENIQRDFDQLHRNYLKLVDHFVFHLREQRLSHVECSDFRDPTFPDYLLKELKIISYRNLNHKVQLYTHQQISSWVESFPQPNLSDLIVATLDNKDKLIYAKLIVREAQMVVMKFRKIWNRKMLTFQRYLKYLRTETRQKKKEMILMLLGLRRINRKNFSFSIHFNHLFRRNFLLICLKHIHREWWFCRVRYKVFGKLLRRWSRRENISRRMIRKLLVLKMSPLIIYQFSNKDRFQSENFQPLVMNEEEDMFPSFFPSPFMKEDIPVASVVEYLRNEDELSFIRTPSEHVDIIIDNLIEKKGSVDAVLTEVFVSLSVQGRESLFSAIVSQAWNGYLKFKKNEPSSLHQNLWLNKLIAFVGERLEMERMKEIVFTKAFHPLDIHWKYRWKVLENMIDDLKSFIHREEIVIAHTIVELVKRDMRNVNEKAGHLFLKEFSRLAQCLPSRDRDEELRRINRVYESLKVLIVLKRKEFQSRYSGMIKNLKLKERVSVHDLISAYSKISYLSIRTVISNHINGNQSISESINEHEQKLKTFIQLCTVYKSLSLEKVELPTKDIETVARQLVNEIFLGNLHEVLDRLESVKASAFETKNFDLWLT